MGVLRLTAERECPTCDEPLGYRRGVVFKNAIFIALLAVVTVGSTFTTGLAQEPEATVELRVWQSVSDPLQVFLSARPEGGRWGSAERLPMARTNARGTLRYSDRVVTVPIGGGGEAECRLARVAARKRPAPRVPLSAPLRG